jgi:hypothetical protein
MQDSMHMVLSVSYTRSGFNGGFDCDPGAIYKGWDGDALHHSFIQFFFFSFEKDRL